MNRAIALLILTVAIAGGLGYFALMGPGARPAAGPGHEAGGETSAQQDTGPKAVDPSPSRADLAAVTPDRASPDFDPGGAPARAWEIIPMNQVGQPIPTAKITATHGSGAMTAEGRVRWTQVPSGTWKVVIEAEDMPRYETEVTLEPDGRRRTIARLGHEFRVEGTVVDTFDQPVTRVTVYFLPTGIGHPTNAIPLQQPGGASDSQGNEASGTGRSAWKTGKGRVSSTGPAGDTVAVQTDASGRFRAVLSKAGKWRISVGPLGDARWTQKKGMELRNGGPSVLLVTVPALAQMDLKFSGPDGQRPSKVTIYRFDSELAARAASKRGGGPDGKGGDGGENARSMKKAVAIAKKRAMERRTPGGAKTGGGEAGGKGNAKLSGGDNWSQEQQDDTAASGFKNGGGGAAGRTVQTPLFEPGWQPLRSVQITASETTLGDLPGREDLKFLFVRGTERISTSATTRLRNGVRSVGTVSLPRPFAGSGRVTQSNLATISLRVLPKDESDDVEPGVVFMSRQ